MWFKCRAPNAPDRAQVGHAEVVGRCLLANAPLPNNDKSRLFAAVALSSEDFCHESNHTMLPVSSYEELAVCIGAWLAAVQEEST